MGDFSEVSKHSALLVATDSHVGFLIDVGERRVERLRCGIVERTWGSVMFTGDHDNRLNLGVSHQAHLLILGLMNANTGHIGVNLFRGLLGLRACLDRERKSSLITGTETPISTVGNSLGLLVLLGLARERILPGDTSAQVIPVEVTVEGDKRPGSPEDPTHFADHPGVGFTHVVSNMEHHL